MLIGYARVSTIDQNTDLQIDALKQAGCEKIFSDQMSGAIAERPGLIKMKEMLRRGDTLVIWRLDRLGRSLKDLIEWMVWLNEHGIILKSLQESIDTNSATGKMIYGIFGVMAEFERNLNKERSEAGLAAARARGRVGGRPEKLNNKKKEMAVSLYLGQQHSIKEICELADISKPTLYKYVHEASKEFQQSLNT